MEKNTQAEIFNLCPNCGAKCKSVYKYCNECGAALQNSSVIGSDNSASLSADHSPTSFTPTPPMPPKSEVTQDNESNVNQNIFSSQKTVIDTTTPTTKTYNSTTEQNEKYEQEPLMKHFFDGVSAEDMFDYTGKKPKLYAKLRQQQMAPMNKLFCLPLLIVGILFGFFGMACWYIYHKLYKQAALFFGLSLFFYIINIAGAYSMIDAFLEAIPQLINSTSPEPTDQEIAMIMQTILKSFPFALSALSNIGSLAQFVLAIVMPFYAYNTYRLIAIDRIKKTRALPYNVDVSTVGGTSKGYLVLAIGIGIIITILAAALLMAPIFESFFEMLAESPELFEDIPTHSFNPYSDFVY